MTVALALFGYVAVAAVTGPALLTRAQWPSRAPRLGIAAWFGWLTSLWLAAVLGGLVLAVPTALVGRGLAELLRACFTALQAWYATPGGAFAATAGLLLSALVTGRFGYCLAGVLRHARRARRRHHDALTLVSRPHPPTGSVLIDHDRPAAYCVPGRPDRVVLTTGALHALDGAQLRVVLAHEHAHLRGRHHLLLATAHAAERAFPVPALRTAHREIGRLVEMLADDHAGTENERLDLAEALLTLAAAPVPQAGLAAGGSAAASRVRRLLTPHRPLSTARAAATTALTALAVALPATIATQPAIAASYLPYCQPGAGHRPAVATDAGLACADRFPGATGDGQGTTPSRCVP